MRSFPLFSASKLIRSSRRWFQTKRQQPKVFVRMYSFRAFPGKAREYEEEKLRLARLYKDDRKSYTASKAGIIGRLIQEARRWKSQA